MIKKIDIGVAALVFASAMPNTIHSEQETHYDEIKTEATKARTGPCSYKIERQEVFLNDLFDMVKKSNPCMYKLPQIEKEKKEITYHI